MTEYFDILHSWLLAIFMVTRRQRLYSGWVFAFVVNQCWKMFKFSIRFRELETILNVFTFCV